MKDNCITQGNLNSHIVTISNHFDRRMEWIFLSMFWNHFNNKVFYYLSLEKQKHCNHCLNSYQDTACWPRICQNIKAWNGQHIDAEWLIVNSSISIIAEVNHNTSVSAPPMIWVLFWYGWEVCACRNSAVAPVSGQVVIKRNSHKSFLWISY